MAASSLPREEPVVGENGSLQIKCSKGTGQRAGGEPGGWREGGQPWSPMNIHDSVLEVGFLRCILAELCLDKVMSFSRGHDTAVSSAVLSSPSRL